MEFYMTTIEADILISPGALTKSEPNDTDAKWRDVSPPFVNAKERTPKKDFEMSCLVVEEDLTSAHVLIKTDQTHDGTFMFTQCAVAAVSQTAEEYVKEHKGEWVASKVIINSEYTRADMSYGKNRPVIKETVLICLNNKAAPKKELAGVVT